MSINEDAPTVNINESILNEMDPLTAAVGLGGAALAGAGAAKALKAYNKWAYRYQEKRFAHDQGTAAVAKEMRKVRNNTNAKKRRIKAKLKEDAPTVNAGGGNVDGIGVGPRGEPGVSVKAQRKHNRGGSTPTSVIINMLKRKAPNPIVEDLETFAGSVVFEVSSKVFHQAKMEKRSGKHWRKYLDEDDCFADIREYAHKNPKRGIVLRNESTGEMCYARYPKKKR